MCRELVAPTLGLGDQLLVGRARDCRPRVPLRQHAAEVLRGPHARAHVRHRPVRLAAEASEDRLDDRRVVVDRRRDRACAHPRREHERRHARPEGAELRRVVLAGRRRHVVVEAAVLVVGDDHHRLLPQWPLYHGVEQRQRELLARVQVGRRVVVVRARRPEGEVDEVGIDPRDRRQLPLRRALHEARVTEHVALVEVPWDRPGRVLRVDDPEHRHIVVREPHPWHGLRLHRVELTTERLQVVRPRRTQRLQLAAGGAGHRIAAVRHRLARHRAEPLVADAEVGRKVVVDRKLRGRVVGHHRSGAVAT